MVSRLRLKTFLTLYPIAKSVWGVRGGDGEFWSLRLQDPDSIRCLGVVLPCLDGSSTKEQLLVAVATAGLDRKVGVELLDKLEAAGFIESVDDAGLSPDQLESYRDQIKLFSRFTVQGGAHYQAILHRSRVAVAGAGSLANALCRTLATSGLGQITSLHPGGQRTPPDATDAMQIDRTTILPRDVFDPAPKVLAVIQTAHDPQLLEAVDVFSKKHTVPWLLIRFCDQMEGWVGPLFVPGDTASYVSFEARLRANMPNYDSYVAFDTHIRNLQHPGGDVGALHSFSEVLAGIAATEIVKYVTGISVPVLAGKFISVNLWTLDTELHEVLRLPRLEAEASARPGAFPWKDLPYGAKTRRA